MEQKYEMAFPFVTDKALKFPAFLSLLYEITLHTKYWLLILSLLRLSWCFLQISFTECVIYQKVDRLPDMYLLIYMWDFFPLKKKFKCSHHLKRWTKKCSSRTSVKFLPGFWFLGFFSKALWRLSCVNH